MGNIRALPIVLALILFGRVSLAQEEASTEANVEPTSPAASAPPAKSEQPDVETPPTESESEKQRTVRTLFVVNDPKGGVITRQLSLSALLLYAGMSNQSDKIGLFAEAEQSVRSEPQILSDPQAFASLREQFKKLNEFKKIELPDVASYALKVLDNPQDDVADAVVIVAHADKDGTGPSPLGTEVTTRLNKRNIQVFTVVLGAKEVPSAFIEAADGTRAKTFTVKRGSDLKNAFGEIFTILHNTEKLPIVSNKVLLDESISDATVILPKKHKRVRNKVVTPNDKVLEAKTKYPGVKWQSFADYDLVRIENPEVGTWRFETPADGEGAMGVVNSSKIQLHVLVEPERPMVGGQTRLKGYLTHDGTVIDSYSKLKHMVMEAEVEDPSGRMHPVRLSRAENGTFIGEIGNEVRGYHAVRLSVFSPELRRERRLSYLVNPECFSGRLEEERRQVIVNMSQTCPRFVELYAMLKVSADDTVVNEQSFVRDGRILVAGIPEPELGEEHQIEVDIQGKTIDGFIIRSDGGGPYEEAARIPTLVDYILAVGKRWIILNIPIFVGFLGFMAVRQARRVAGTDLENEDWEDNE